MARVWAEIDLSAVAANTRAVHERVGPNVAVMAVVKADAYGQGAGEFARTVLAAGAERLAVASVAEGCQLRRQRIGAPIHVLGAVLTEELGLAIANGLSVTVGSLREIEELHAAAVGIGRRAVVHLNVDTGMGRLGALPDEALRIARALTDLSTVEFEGVSTHFHAAGEGGGESVRAQFARFRAVREELENDGLEIPMYHAGASAVVELHPGTWLNMIRPGILLHGVRSWTAPEVGALNLTPALQIKTTLAAVRPLPAGHNVGYGVNCTLARDSFVATLTAGYSDGVARSLSNRGEVLIGGQRCKILGSVCMDYLMADVTDLAQMGRLPKRGAEAVLIGNQGNARISVEEIAFAAGTVPHEILCRVGERVKQTYRGGANAAEALEHTEAGRRWSQRMNAFRAGASRRTA